VLKAMRSDYDRLQLSNRQIFAHGFRQAISFVAYLKLKVLQLSCYQKPF